MQAARSAGEGVASTAWTLRVAPTKPTKLGALIISLVTESSRVAYAVRHMCEVELSKNSSQQRIRKLLRKTRSHPPSPLTIDGALESVRLGSNVKMFHIHVASVSTPSSQIVVRRNMICGTPSFPCPGGGGGGG